MINLKSLIPISIFILIGGKTFGQQLVTDPILTGSTIVGGIQQNNRLDDMKQHQTMIERYQLLAVTQLGFINDWQKKMYEGLSQVASAVRDSKNIIEATTIVNDIIKYQLVAANYAKGDPILIIFAQKTESDFKNRALDMVVYISTVALKGGKDMLMDAGQRAELINRIVTDLRVIRGLAYTASRQMYWARMDGIFRSLNPFAGYVNQDQQIANDILRNYKF
ncbi:MAG: hypothetical protein V4456_11355 [Bacteroidota bacterium]